jgi:hypothetical protein
VREPFLERGAQVLGDRHVNAHVLVQLGAIDVHVDLARRRRVGFQIAGHAIVETHAERDQQIGFLNRVIDPCLAVHAHHPEVERMRRGDAANAEQRHGNRDLRALGELDDLLLDPGQHDAVAGENQRPLGGVDQLERVARLAVARQRRVVGLAQLGSPRRPSPRRCCPAGRPW